MNEAIWEISEKRCNTKVPSIWKYLTNHATGLTQGVEIDLMKNKYLQLFSKQTKK